MLYFESDLTPGLIATGFPTVVHEEPELPGDLFPGKGPFTPFPSNKIIQVDQPVHLHIRFNVKGAMAAALCDYEWKIDVIGEEWGGKEGGFGTYSATIKHVSSSNHNYHAMVGIPANSVQPGLYKIAVCVTLISCNGLQVPVTGFEELKMCKFIDPA